MTTNKTLAPPPKENPTKATTLFNWSDPFMGPDDMALHLLRTWERAAETALSKQLHEMTELEKFSLARSCGATVFTGTYDHGKILGWETEPVGFIKEENRMVCYVIRDGKPFPLTSRSCPSPSAQEQPAGKTEWEKQKLGWDGPDFYGDGM